MTRSPDHHSPPGVLHVANPGRVGGLESVVRLLARGQLAAGHQVQVCAVLESDPTKHPFARALQEDGIEVLALRIPPRGYVSEWRELEQVFRRIRPAIVHTHGARSDVLAGWVAGRVGLPRVTTVHGFTGGDLKNRVYEWCQTLSYRRFDAVVAVSAPLVERLVSAGVSRNRVHMVRNAWSSAGGLLPRAEARAALGLDRGDFVIGWVGRLTREKGLDVLIDALSEYGDDPPVLAVVGEGRERPALEARASALGVGAQIRWCGEVPEASRLFQAFDLLVLSSRTEGTPIVLFEAMASKTPIIATRVGGVPDVVGDHDGWLVPPENPSVLAQTLRSARTDPGRRRTLAESASLRLERDFAPDAWVRRYDEVYRAALLGEGVKR